MKTKLYAPESFWELEDKSELNGCGPKSAGLMVPDTIFGLNISAACNIHDHCYTLKPYSISTKDWADRIFLNNILRLNESTKWRWLKRLRRWSAYRYYNAVRKFGGIFYWRGKNRPSEESVI